LWFDAGPPASATESQVNNLELDSVYTPAEGFGWLNRPEKAFARPELNRSRTAWTIDGVEGDRFGFRADLDSGMWYLTLWLEAERTDTCWPRVVVQGQQRALHWQKFQADEEPGPLFEKAYRVFHCTTSVGPEGLSLELVGIESPVRLLGVSLIQCVCGTKPEHHKFLRRIERASNYHDGGCFDHLLRRAEESLRKNPTDAFYAIWRLRLELLATAERYSTMRGWQWADEETGMGMFDRQCQAVTLLDGLLSPDLAEAPLLADRAMYARGRLLYWMGKERGGVDEIANGKRDLQTLAEKYPSDELLAMYTGARIDPSDPCDCLDAAADAPAWSTVQREALCRLRQLVHWWVIQRQNEHGELGGKLRDDVEILRWWAPLCLAGDETAIRGWKKLADGVWQSKHVFEGYAKQVADVEHAAEFVADTAPLMQIYSDDHRYAKRLAYSARHFESRWTGKTINGNRHFRSAWFSSTHLETDEPKGRDLEYNTRAVQAMRYLAWRHPNPKLVGLLHEWSTSWTNAAMRTDKGKPKGLIPASIRFADEAFNGDGPHWYRANMYWDYFEWEHFAGSLMLDQLLFTYTLTKDQQLLQPMFMSLELIRSEEPSSAVSKNVAPEEGSAAWATAMLVRSSDFWKVVEQWRFLTDDPRWDDLIMRHGTAYGRYRISGDERHLIDGLNLLLDDLRYNTPLKTTEAVHTDRLYVRGTEFLKAMLSGDGMYSNSSPYYSVSWQQTDDNFTALVEEANPKRLEVELFSYAAEDRQVIMRVWQLIPGNYQLQSHSKGFDGHAETITIAERGQRIPLMLPSQRPMRITLAPTVKD